MRLAICACAMLLLCSGRPASGAEKDDENATKTPEQLAVEAKERTTVAGKFRIDRALLADGKELPKVIGSITPPKGATYFVIVSEKSFMELLASSDGKEMTLCGNTVIVPGKGGFLLADSQITPPTPPTSRRKRGGL